MTSGYDDLNRLTSASGFTGGATAAYSYDVIGNVRTKTEGTSSLTLAYPAPGQPRPHAVQSTTGSLVRAFVYDAAGNQLGSGHDASHAFDAEGRLAATLDVQPQAAIPVPAAGLTCTDVSGDGTVGFADVVVINAASGASTMSATPPYDVAYDLTEDGHVDGNDVSQEMAAFGKTCPSTEQHYIYDAAGQLVERTSGKPHQTPTSTTTYVDGIYEATNTGAVTKYYTALGRTIAMRKSGTLSYLLQDHLGSTVGMLDASGALIATQSYWPYGAVRTQTGTLPTDKQYTGQQQEPGDAALGLYDYKARFYSTVLGRFVSADPVVGAAYDPQAWNGYSYVGNNPLGRTDPTGERWCNSDECDPASSASMNHPDSNSLRNPGSTCSLCDALIAIAAFNQNVGTWCGARPQDCGGGAVQADISAPIPFPVPIPIPGWCPCPHVSGQQIDQAFQNFKDNWTSWGEAIAGVFNSDDAPVIGPDGQQPGPVPPPRSLDDPGSLTGATPVEIDGLVPSGWSRSPTRSGGGTRYLNPTSRNSDEIRVMPGNPQDSNPVKRGPYARVARNGTVSEPIPLAGNPTLP